MLCRYRVFILFSWDQTFRKRFWQERMDNKNGQNSLEMILEALRQTIELRILPYITSRMKRKFLKILVSLWGCTFFFCFRKFQKTEKTIISFASWNFGTILKAVVAFVVIEPTILKSLHTLFVLCNAPQSVLLKSCFHAKTFAICVLFYQSLSTRIKTLKKG